MTTFDHVLLAVELGVGVLVGFGFLIPYVARRTWRRSPWGWHMVAVTFVMTGEGCAFLAILLGFEVPIWVFEVGFGLIDLVGIQRLWLFLTTRTPVDSKPTSRRGG